MKRNRNSLLLAALFLLATACTEKKVCDEYSHVPSSGWQRDNVLLFHTDSIPQDGNYALLLKLRTNSSFPFMNVVVIADQTICPSNMHFSDTITCRLFDDKGKSLGKGLGIFQYEFDINRMELKQGDTLLINIRHDMRRDLLPGITDVGVELTRSN